MKYILIDYENIQPLILAPINHDAYTIIVFVGAHQTKIPFDVVAALQPLGERASYIRISGAGHNALDLHIAFYLGHWATRDPTATFYIVSRDTGFDRLIEHLTANAISVQRLHDSADLQNLAD